MTVRKAQTNRSSRLPTVGAANAATMRKRPTMIRIQPMKIAVPTDAAAGTMIATQPTRIATIPIAISALQVRRKPSCASGSAARPPHLHVADPKRRRRTGSTATEGVLVEPGLEPG